MDFVFHTRGEAMEPPHIHIYRGKGPKRDQAKIWLRDLSVAKMRGFRLSDVAEMVRYLVPLQQVLIAEYESEISTIGK